MEYFPWNSVWYWNMEFHESISMEFYGVPQKLNSMEFCLVLGHGIPWNSMKTFRWNSMEFHKSSTPWNSVWYQDFEVHEKVSMEFHRKLVCKEFRITSIKIFLQPLISTELDKDFITY